MGKMVATRTLVMYTLLLTIFSMFSIAFLEGGDIEDAIETDKFTMLSTTQNIITQLGDSHDLTDKIVIYLKLAFFIPMSILAVVLQFAVLPFVALQYLPPIVSFFLYTPYTIILFFDVLLPIVMKISELIVKTIEAIIPF